MNEYKGLKLYAIVGMPGAGKSVVVDYLTERGMPKVYFGGMIYREMEKRGIERTLDGRSERAFREHIRETEGQDWVGRQAVAEVKDLVRAGQKNIVLDGLYSWTEYKLFKKEFPGALVVIAVVTPRAVRYERLAKRPDRPFTEEAARYRDYGEIENMEKGGPIANADYYILNEGTREELFEQLGKVLKKIEG